MRDCKQGSMYSVCTANNPMSKSNKRIKKFKSLNVSELLWNAVDVVSFAEKKEKYKILDELCLEPLMERAAQLKEGLKKLSIYKKMLAEIPRAELKKRHRRVGR